MGTKRRMIAAAALVSLGAATGCEEPVVKEPEEAAEELAEDIEEERGLAAPAGETAVPSVGFEGVKELVAPLRGTEGNEDVEGVVRFEEVGVGEVKVTAHVEGLTAGEHGFHIHQWGDCSAPDGTSAGGHYDPRGVPHALPEESPRHVGDMGNLEANDEGMAHLEETFDTMTLVGPEVPIIGRGVIVHAEPDTGAQPTGEAGARVACGVVGVAEGASGEPESE